jgi:hypothetical protein
MRPVEFGEGLAAGTRLVLFSDDKPDRFFTVITFLIDAISGVALDLETGVPCYQVEESIYSFICQSGRKMKTAGASGGPIRQVLILGLFLMGRWLRSRKVRFMVCRQLSKRSCNKQRPYLGYSDNRS